MYQLAIECSGLHGSLSLLRESQIIDTIRLSTERSSVQSLASTVKALINQHRSSIDFISVTQGPGSFTGLRVGLTTAKMLGLAWQLPLVAVNTLEVLACQILDRQPSDTPTIIVPVINAFRRQVFAAGWLSVQNNSIIPIAPTQVVDADLWIKQPLMDQPWPIGTDFELPLGPRPHPGPEHLLYSFQTAVCKASKILVGGPGLENYLPASVCEKTGLAVQIVEGVGPEASWVGKIGWIRFQAGQTESPLSLTANYVRASAAEDKLVTAAKLNN